MTRNEVLVRKLEEKGLELERLNGELAKSEGRLRAIFDAEPECVKLLAADGSLLEINPAGLRMLEADSFQQVANRCVLPLVVEEHRPAFRDLMEKVFRGESGTLAFQMTGLQGGRRWLETHATPLRDATGATAALVGITRDITASKQAEAALRESEANFRALFEQAAVGVAQIETVTGRFARVNRRYCEIVGYTAEELQRLTFQAITHPEDLQADMDSMARLHRGDINDFSVEKRYFRKDGAIVWVAVTVSAPWNFGGSSTFHTAVVEDITERKRAEEALHLAHRQREDVIASVDGIVWEADADTFRFTFVSPRAERLLGYPTSRWTEEPTFWADHIHPDDREAAVRYCGQCTLEKRDHEFEYRMLAADGRAVWLRDIVTVMVESGRPAKLRGIMVDTTEHKRAIESLQRSEERFRELAETLDDVFWTSDPVSNRMLYVSPGYEKTWGHSCQSLYEQPEAWLNTIHPADRDRVQHAITTRMAGGTYDEEYRIVRPDGEVRWVRDRARPVRNAAGQIERVVGVARDVHERRTAEEELRRREERFRSLIEHAADMIGVIDHQGLIRFLSPSADNILGYPAQDVVGRNSLEFVHPDDVPHTTAALQKAAANPATAVRVEFRVRRRDGQWRTLQTIGRSIPDQAADGFIVLNSRDVTDSRHLEEQLRQSQKMEAIGQLAGGIAHDFNNLLTVINGTAEVALSNLNVEDPLRADLLEILGAGDRAASLTRQLLAFGRKQIMMPDVLDLNAVVSDMLRMLQRLIGEHIEIVFKPGENLASVRADPSQIEQVLMNLVVNARDAMGNGGGLTIDTCNVVLDAAFAAGHPSVEPGPHVMLAVTDTGVGMDESICKRIFEPFFTTKESPLNAGLGLATVYGIVKQSGGTIWVSSEPGRGTTFTIYLPQVERETGKDRSARSAMAEGGTETILIVEDEAGVRNLATRFLRSAGYTVVTAGSGAEALLLLQRDDQPVHLMLTDIVMPGMTGPELAARLAGIRPRMKVLYMSGYTDDTALRHGVVDNAAAFIGKPYSRAELSRKVRDVLDAPDV